MADVVGVVFHNGNKTYYFDPAGLELSRGDRVVVQTMKGSEIGQVVEPPHTVEDAEIPAPLKKVTRVATGKDLEAQAASQTLRKEAMMTCRELIARHGLDMKLVDADIMFGGEKITFSFYSEERVDFRALVADLAKELKMRIELRQVGAREEARLVGGLGPCGRDLCCTLFPGDEDPVSIRMAKEQNLPLNPMKISGLCGRLMCCLKYEQEQYVRFRKEAPAKGTKVSTPAGDGVIVGYNVPKDAITIRLEDGTYTDVKLSGCECRDDGTLLFIPEVDERPVVLPQSEAFELPTSPAGCTPAPLAVVESGPGGGENGASTEGGAEGPKRPRSRRSRGRRGGRSKERTDASGAATKQGGGSGPAEGAGRKDSGGQSGDQGEGGQTKSRSRRRRRPRRPSGGGEAGNGGSGGSSGGDRGGASSGDSSGGSGE